VIVDGHLGISRSHARALSPEVAADTGALARGVGGQHACGAEHDRVGAGGPSRYIADATHGCRVIKIDPFHRAPTAREKIGRAARLLRAGCWPADGVDYVSASFARPSKSRPSTPTHRRLRRSPNSGCGLMPRSGSGHRGRRAAGFDSMRTPSAPPMGSRAGEVAGRRTTCGTGPTSLAQLPSAAWPEKDQGAQRHARPDRSGDRPHPTCGLTIHESIGHAKPNTTAPSATRQAYRRHVVRHPPNKPRHPGATASPVMNVTADRTVEFGFGQHRLRRRGGWPRRVGTWVRDGIFVGYQLDRVFRPPRTWAKPDPTGCSYADSPHHVPIQRMANVSLQPSPENLSTADLIGPESTTASISSVTGHGQSTCRRYNFPVHRSTVLPESGTVVWTGQLARCRLSGPPPPTSGIR